MSPQELDAWISRHGGIDQDTKSMVGQRIVITKDGSRVVLTQLTPDSLRVDDIFEKGAPTAPTETPSETGGPVAPDAPPPARGGATAISKADLEARAGANPNLVYQGQKLIDKTVTEYGIQKTIRVPVVTWLDKRTGYTLSAEVGPGGESYTVTFDGIDEKNKDDAASRNPTQIAQDEKARRDRAEREKNAALPADQDPAYETDAERRKRAQDRIDQQGRDAKADDTTVVGVDYSGTGKNRKKVTTYKSGRTQTEAAPTNATPVSTSYEADGTKVTKYDDGTESREQQAPGTRAAEQRAAEQGAFGVEPEGAPPITYTVGQMTSGLQKYSQWLSQQVKLHKDSGGKQGIAPAEATKLMERRIALAEAAIKEQGDLATAQGSQRGQDITQRGQTLGETQSRRGSAERLMTNAVSNVLPLAKGAGAGNGGLVADAITDLMGAGRGYVDSFGGFRESPEIGAEGFPALAAQRAASMNAINVAAQGGPQIFDPRAPAPAPAPDPAANAAGIMANPIFRPSPPVPSSSTPVTPVANNPIDGSPIVPPSGLPGMGDPAAVRPPMRAMQEMRYGEGNYFDPEMAGVGLTQRLGIHPDIMRQAIGELYG